MFEDMETIVTDILVVMFIASICTIVYGSFVRDAVAVGVGVVLFLLFIFHLWIIKRFRKR